MICSKCGSELKDGAKFCGVCGTPVTNDVDTNNTSNSPVEINNFEDDSFNEQTEIIFDKKIQKDRVKKSSRLPIIISIIGILIVSAVAGVALVVNQKSLTKIGIEQAKDGKVRYNKGNKTYAKNELIYNAIDANGNNTGDSYYFDSSEEMVRNEWIEYQGKWYYAESDGKIAKNKWIESTYYVNEYGEMLKNTTTPGGYKVGADGKWIDPAVEEAQKAAEQAALMKQINDLAKNQQNQYQQPKQTQTTAYRQPTTVSPNPVANVDYSQPIYILSTRKYSDFIEYDDETQVDVVINVPVFGGQNAEEVEFINDALNTCLDSDLMSLIENDIHSKTDDTKLPRKVNISETAVQNITDTRVNVIFKGAIERKSGSSVKVNYRYIYERDNKTGYFRQ